MPPGVGYPQFPGGGALGGGLGPGEGFLSRFNSPGDYLSTLTPSLGGSGNPLGIQTQPGFGMIPLQDPAGTVQSANPLAGADMSRSVQPLGVAQPGNLYAGRTGGFDQAAYQAFLGNPALNPALQGQAQGPNRALAQNQDPQQQVNTSGVGQRLNQQAGISGPGGFLMDPGDVEFMVERGFVTPQQADVLRQVAQQNMAASQAFAQNNPNPSSQIQGGYLAQQTQQQPQGQSALQGNQGQAAVQQQTQGPAQGQAGGGGGIIPNGGVMPGMRFPLPGFAAGGGQVPGGQFPDPNLVPTGPTNQFPLPGGNYQYPWNSFPIANAMLGPFGNIVPGFENTIPPGFAGFKPGSRANLFNLTSGIFAGDPAGLPGEAGPLLGTAANLTLGLAQAQEARNRLAQQNVLNAVQQVQTNPGVAGASGVLSGLATNPYTTSSDALQEEIEGMLTRRFANAREGLLGTLGSSQAARGALGGESDLLRAGADFGTRADLADALAEARVNQALRRQRDIGESLDAFEQGGDVLQGAVLGPAALGAQTLAGRSNQYTNALLEQIRQLGALSAQDKLRENTPTFGSLGPILGGAGRLFGNLLGVGGLFGEKGLLGD